MAAKINLGRVSLVPAGEWDKAKAYKRLDVVSVSGTGAYVAKQDVPAGTAITATAYWQVSADAGAAKALVTQMQAAETARVQAETARQTAETARAKAETVRTAAESARAAAEPKRAEAETARAAAETARVDAEKQRAADQAKNNADQAANNQAAQGLMVTVVADGQYDPTTLEPTGTGEVGKLYLVPDPHATGDNVYAEWMWVDSKWERVGSSNATVAGLTTDQVDTVAGGGSVTSDAVVNGTVLTYLWSKLKAVFATVGHKHDAADVTSGVLPVARGGTGAGTAAGALTALGAASAADMARAVTARSEVTGVQVGQANSSKQRVVIRVDGFNDSGAANVYLLIAADTYIGLYDSAKSAWVWRMNASA